MITIAGPVVDDGVLVVGKGKVVAVGRRADVWRGTTEETENLSMETAGVLRKAGIPFAWQSGYECYVPKTRVVLFEAAIAAAYGLPFDAALAAVTLEAARPLGMADRVGSLEAGKDADLALFDGDPFEYTSHVTGVMIGGRMVSEERR